MTDKLIVFTLTIVIKVGVNLLGHGKYMKHYNTIMRGGDGLLY
jgi:hypothetical protein